MVDLIIRDFSDLAEYFESYPSRTYGRKSSFSLDMSTPRASTGYSAIKRAAERINAFGDNLRVDEVLSMENWDLVK